MKKMLLFILLLLNIPVYGMSGYQSVEGKVCDDKGKPLPGISVSVNGTGIIDATNENGYYSVYVPDGKTQISFKSVCYEDRTVMIDKNDELNVTLNLSAKKMEDITKGNVVIQDDTLAFKVSAFSGSYDKKIGDVLKKLPGITVDAENNVTSQGKAIVSVRVNDKIIFKGDVQKAIKTLQTDKIQTIQVIDDYSSSANKDFRGFEPDRVINFITKQQTH